MKESGKKILWWLVAPLVFVAGLVLGYPMGAEKLLSFQTFDECMEENLKDLPFKSLAHVYVECGPKNIEGEEHSVPDKWRDACLLHLSRGAGDFEVMLAFASYCGTSPRSLDGHVRFPGVRRSFNQEVKELLEQQEKK